VVEMWEGLHHHQAEPTQNIEQHSAAAD
jgi:hypothetical protein